MMQAKYRGFEYEQVVPPMCRKNSRRSRRAGPFGTIASSRRSREVVVPEAWKFRAGRNNGAGNKTLEWPSAQQWMQFRKSIRPGAATEDSARRDAGITDSASRPKNSCRMSRFKVTDSVHERSWWALGFCRGYLWR